MSTIFECKGAEDLAKATKSFFALEEGDEVPQNATYASRSRLTSSPRFNLRDSISEITLDFVSRRG